MTAVPNDNTAATVAALIKELYGHQVITVSAGGVEAPVLIRPTNGGLAAESVKKFVDEYRTRPERREGTAVMTTLDSLIDHVNRFKDGHSALFASNDRLKPSLQAVLDYHLACNFQKDGEEHSDTDATPRFGRHRCRHDFPLSDEWKLWTASNKKALTQSEFAAFIEERILDVLPAPVLTGDLFEADQELARIADLLRGTFAGPERMMDLSRGLAVHESSKVLAAVNLASGEGGITFETEHHDGNGEKLSVPSLFCVGIPVFDGGDRYRVVARLRYRKSGGGLTWFYELYRHDRVFRDAFDGACTKAREDTGLPLFVGAPETATSN